jgi:hypothetical protein
MMNYYENTDCSIINSQYKDVMNLICGNLLQKTSGAFEELLFLEQITFIMFLISFCTIGMNRPKPKDKTEIEDAPKDKNQNINAIGSTSNPEGENSIKNQRDDGRRDGNMVAVAVAGEA